MSYAAFLAYFILIPIAALLVLAWRGPRHPRAWWAILLTAAIAFVYTTPWDNYLVYRGVWTYGADRVIAVIGYVPVEEYLFFVLQPIMTGLFFYVLIQRRPITSPTPWRAQPLWLIPAMLSLIGLGLLMSGWNPGLYAGLILAWAGPVLTGLWLYGGAHAVRLGRVVGVAVAVPTVYLWIADRTAIALGIWDIADAYSLGFDPLGLPIEEALFFLVTNVLSVMGTLLFLHGHLIKPPSIFRFLDYNNG